MILYLLKSITVMGLLLGLYYLLLSRERLHRFSRFFLLGALVVSLVAPLVTFRAKESRLPAFSSIPVVESLRTTHAATVANTVIVPKEEKRFRPEVFATYLYLVVVAMLLIRFAANLYGLFKLISRGKQERIGTATLVLVDQDVLPFSFMRYIFLQRSNYESGSVGQEIICHELTHIRQLHSLDIIFVEILQVALWFNPFVYLYRHFIKQNHEYLADEAVVNQHNDVYKYQQLLLEMIFRKNTPSLVSNISFSLTKKRLIMMTKKTSRFKRLMVAVLTLFAISFVTYSFCVVKDKPLLLQTSKDSLNTKTVHSIQRSWQDVESGENMMMLIPSDSTDLKHGIMINKMAREGMLSTFQGVSLVILNYTKEKPGGKEAAKMQTKLAGNKRGDVNSESSRTTKNLNSIDDEEFSIVKSFFEKRLLCQRVPPVAYMKKWIKMDKVSVWIDDKHVDSPSELSKYKNVDFSLWTEIRFAFPQSGINKGKLYKVLLMTNEKFQQYVKKNEEVLARIKNKEYSPEMKLYFFI